MATTIARLPSISTELGGSDLAGARNLYDQRDRRRRGTALRAPGREGGASSVGDGASSIRYAPGGPLPRAPKVSPRQRRRVEDTHAYLCARVDPVMGLLVLALVTSRPEDIRKAALDHLLAKRRGNVGEGAAKGRTVGDAEPERESGKQSPVANAYDDASETEGGEQRLVRRQDRLFMACEIGPLITELINRTLRCMPADVEGFLIEQLQSATTITPREHRRGRMEFDYQRSILAGAQTGENYTDDRYRRSHNAQQQQEQQQQGLSRPSTARSRLQQAQSLDLHVQQASPALSERVEERMSPVSPRRLNNSDLSNDTDGINGEAGLSSTLEGGDRVVAEGVRESRNKPWDVEVSSKATLPLTTVQLNKAPRVAVILLLGLDGAGKTTLLGTLQGDQNPRVRPSIGFKPVTMMLSDELKVKFYDLGGGENIRSIWDKYYHDAHGLLYVVDGADGERWGASKDLFQAATSHKYLQGKPVAVILNKEDAGMLLKPEQVARDLGLASRRDAKVCCCSANASKAKGGVPDERLEGAVEWLLESVKGSFTDLNERVQCDLQDMEREFQLEKERKQLGVLRGLLGKAFLEKEGAERDDCFDEAEGLEFLEGEVGLEAGKLSEEGVEIANLVGYQKLALQMVGNMKSPISRKNRARSWGEIRQLILNLRKEIGIDP